MNFSFHPVKNKMPNRYKMSRVREDYPIFKRGLSYFQKRIILSAKEDYPLRHIGLSSLEYQMNRVFS